MKHWFYFGFCTLMLIGCKKDTPMVIDNLNGGEVMVIGHGAIGFSNPDQLYQTNSWPAILKAADGLQADGLELDVQMSADSVFMIYHDELLEESTTCTDCLNNRNYDELTACRYNNSIHQNNGAHMQLVVLEDVLSHFSTYASPPKLFLDLKFSNACTGLSHADTAVAQKLIHLIQSHQAAAFVNIGTTNFSFALYVKQLLPALDVCYDTRNIEAAIENPAVEQLDGIIVDNGNITTAQVEALHQKEIWVYLFNVRAEASHYDALEKHPDGIMTDNLPLLKDLLLQDQ